MRLYTSFDHDVERLRGVFQAALVGGLTLDHQTPAMNRAAAWHCLINLADTWSRFCKQAVLTSASGRVLTRRGTALSRSRHVRWHDDPERVLQALYHGNGMYWGHFGPKWEVPSATIGAAQLLDIDNFTQFSRGIGLASPAPAELKACRNYLAHRHMGTALDPEVRALRRRVGALGTSIAPAALAARYVPGRGVRVFEEWCIDLQQMAALALE